MNPPQRSPQEGAAPQQPMQPGYLPERRYSARPLRQTWQLGKTTVDTVFLAPATRERLPLIIYLPGLGESAAAGELWRQAWAEAGYAVLSLQPAELGEAAWAQAKTGENQDPADRERQRQGTLDRRDRVREQYSAAALARRLDLVARAGEELRRRAGDDSNYAVADGTRIIVAGYDIGARTAAALAGEEIKGASSPSAFRVEAAILLSPYVDLAAGTGKQRFAAMRAPVLAVTGTEDDDPDLLVSTPSLRRVPWQSMPAGDKYLLLLENGIHAALAGNPGEHRVEQDASREGSGARADGRQPPGGGGRRAVPFGGGGPGGMMGGQDGPPRDGERSSPGSIGNRHASAVQTVSTAFLDATVKNDPVADEWLRRNATRWLASSASLWIR